MEPQPEHPPSDRDLPPSLLRALVETAEYAVRLRTGEIVRFTRAERQGSFVVLYAPGGPPGDPRLADSIAAFPRGVEVRISDIVWCARGPTQSAEPEAPSVGSVADSRDVAPQPPGVRVPLRIKRGDAEG